MLINGVPTAGVVFCSDGRECRPLLEMGSTWVGVGVQVRAREFPGCCWEEVVANCTYRHSGCRIGCADGGAIAARRYRGRGDNVLMETIVRMQKDRPARSLARAFTSPTVNTARLFSILLLRTFVKVIWAAAAVVTRRRKV